MLTPGASSAGEFLGARTPASCSTRLSRPCTSGGLSRAAVSCTIAIGGCKVNSSGRRNTAYVSCSEELVQSLGRCSPAQGLSRPAVEGDRHGCKVLGAVHAEVGALWKVLAQQPVGVLVRATLPGAVRVAEGDRHASLDPELGVLGHFRSLIPRQRLSQLFG